MNVRQTNITLGTAGHIDHGKTALVKCLTGCDTDRLKEEKERGMSIELGFAPFVISNMEVGIVDVPGHENFIRTMVAGATGIDGVIFVIAADDGVMPQTREHLDILTLLGVRYGIVALTKVDNIDPSCLESVIADVRSFLKGTFLESAPIAPLSNKTGQGFDVFFRQLETLVNSIEPKSSEGIFRMPIERTFFVKGYGTVVTGVVVSGSARIGGEVVLFPHVSKGRIRAIQVYKRSSELVLPGQCAAINVPQWDYKAIKRGNVVTVGEYFWPAKWYICRLQLLDYKQISIKNGAQIKFHTGTSEAVASVYLLEGSSICAGQESLVEVCLSEPVLAGPCDRFIARSLSPPQTIGGGMIIEAIQGKLRRNKPEVLHDVRVRSKAVLTREDFVAYCARTAKNLAADENDLAVRAKIPPVILKDVLARLVGLGKVIDLDRKLYMHSDIAASMEQKLSDIVRNFHRDRPESPGINMEHFFRESHIPKDVFEVLIKRLIRQGKFVERKDCIALPEHHEKFSADEEKLLSAVEMLFKDRLFNPPGWEDIIENTKASTDKLRKVLRILSEQKRIIPVDENLFFHQEAVERARQILVSYISREGRLESVEFKYIIETTRKFAIPLLDYFDKVGVTRRIGNTRYLKVPPEKLSNA